MIAQGFPANKILLGTATLTGTSVPGGAGTAATYAKAFSYLERKYGIRGAMVWQSDSDGSDNWAYEQALHRAGA